MPYKPISKVEQSRKKQREHDYDKARYDTQKFYYSKAWQRMRAYMRQKYQLCAECLKNGIVKAGEIVDHITPIKDGGAMLDESNLQVLCYACHNRKHAHERATGGRCENFEANAGTPVRSFT